MTPDLMFIMTTTTKANTNLTQMTTTERTTTKMNTTKTDMTQTTVAKTLQELQKAALRVGWLSRC